MNNIYAYTEVTGQTLPAYVSLNERDGKYYLYVRTRGEEYASVMEVSLEELLKMGASIELKLGD
jgi:hypothetical protein